jgi:hypothetical protein
MNIYGALTKIMTFFEFHRYYPCVNRMLNRLIGIVFYFYSVF